MSKNTESILFNGNIYHSDNLAELKLLSETTWQREIVDFLTNWFDDSDEIITRTSGSTGKPKEIRMAKEIMRNSARMTNQFFGMNASKTALLCLPASYIAGKMMLLRAIIGGYPLISVEPKANPFDEIKIPVDFTAITPYQLHHSSASLQQKEVRNIIVGGGHVNAEMEALAAKIPAAMFETYGMTETCSHVALRPINGEKKSNGFVALNGVSFRQDERGCLIIKAPHLSRSEFITNDVVELYSENTFRWLARFDTVINSGGLKIFPEQIEEKLAGTILSGFFVSSLPDPVLGEKVILVIESKEYTEIQKAKLSAAFEKLLGKFEIPKSVYFTEHFVYSASNKILRNETIQKITTGRS